MTTIISPQQWKKENAKALTVKQLIHALKHEDPEALVCFQSPVGYFHQTQQIQAIETCDCLEPSEALVESDESFTGVSVKDLDPETDEELENPPHYNVVVLQ